MTACNWVALPTCVLEPWIPILFRPVCQGLSGTCSLTTLCKLGKFPDFCIYISMETYSSIQLQFAQSMHINRTITLIPEIHAINQKHGHAICLIARITRRNGQCDWAICGLKRETIAPQLRNLQGNPYVATSTPLRGDSGTCQWQQWQTVHSQSSDIRCGAQAQAITWYKYNMVLYHICIYICYTYI